MAFLRSSGAAIRTVNALMCAAKAGRFQLMAEELGQASRPRGKLGARVYQAVPRYYNKGRKPKAEDWGGLEMVGKSDRNCGSGVVWVLMLLVLWGGCRDRGPGQQTGGATADQTAVTAESQADGSGDEAGSDQEGINMFKELTPDEELVIVHKGTERAYSGKYDKHFEQGAYMCKRCGARLFDSGAKFDAGCGWPSFDKSLGQAVKRQRDADGVRTEILCARCQGHLGHVFEGEGYTAQNARYCVNSVSLDFVGADESASGRAIFASGCFWGTEYYLQRAAGVISTTVGYVGGTVDNPTYKQVCTGKTGHAEAVEVVFDPAKISYEELAKLFFETHDFTQLDRQGPDVGKQYRSGVFYLNDEQKEVATRLVELLKAKGHDVKTEITAAGRFWPGEDYHQDYYNTKGALPYCHVYRKIFD